MLSTELVYSPLLKIKPEAVYSSPTAKKFIASGHVSFFSVSRFGRQNLITTPKIYKQCFRQNAFNIFDNFCKLILQKLEFLKSSPWFFKGPLMKDAKFHHHEPRPLVNLVVVEISQRLRDQEKSKKK